jgi:hypothetical protein
MNKMLISPEVKPLIQELTIAAIYKSEITPTNVKYDTISYNLEAKCGSFIGPKELGFYKVRQHLLNTVCILIHF